MASPQVRKTDDCLGTAGAEQSERVVDDGQLLGTIERLPERMAERPANGNRPRHPQLFGHCAEERDGDCCYPGCLDRALDQSHGLMA